MKLLDEIMGMVRRYGPTLIAHLLLLVGLSLFVLDMKALPNGTSVWTELSDYIDGTLKAVGLSPQRWYVLAALLIAYLTAFEWVRSWVLAIPLLRLSFDDRFDPVLMGAACQVLKLEPDYWKVDRALRFQIDRSEERARQNNQFHPYQGMIDRRSFLIAYYGTLLIFLIAAIVWYEAGPPFAQSLGLVQLMLVLLAVAALVLRWVIVRQQAKLRKYTGYWALDEYERANATGVEDPLTYERRQAMEKLAQAEMAYRRHPASILSRLFRRLPRKWRDALNNRIAFPAVAGAWDWAVLASSRTRFADETITPPSALRTEPFLPRFASLLKREGAGLALLVPVHSGLAPAAERGGSAYSFAMRRHGSDCFGVVLAEEEWPGANFSTPHLVVETGISRGFITKIGDHPIEKLIVPGYSVTLSREWYALFEGGFDDACLIYPYGDETFMAEGGKPLTRAVEVEIGSSYLLAVRMQTGTTARVVLQCFQVEDSDRLLIAWGFVGASSDEVSEVPPWWKPAAWRRLITPLVRWDAPLAEAPVETPGAAEPTA